MQNFPYVVTVSSEKGGVGKTTLATNLAIFLKAICEDLPVTVFSFDNHFTVDKMFQIKGQKPKGDVIDLLSSVPARELIHTGQYGVGYISSAASLAEFKVSMKNPLMLGRLLAVSQLAGIVIIDTRPDLDILTRNALYAADRVIIPVKDMPSLENCRNIFELFDKRGLDKKSLALIPCLVDSRIKYDGPFADQKALLKAYAINRGYRCFDAYISKSPKVESLNTNPDGRIYPILTHARNTDVYGQFAGLAKTVIEEFRTTREPRAFLFRQWLADEEVRGKEAYLARLASISKTCLVCNRPLLQEGSGNAAFYFETADGGAGGFIEEGCYLDFLFTTIYQFGGNLSHDNPAWEVIRESARKSSFVFRTVDNESGAMVEVGSFDLEGMQIMKRLYPLREFEGGFSSNWPNKHIPFISPIIAMGGGKLQDTFLVVHPVDPQTPGSILREENYREFSKLKAHLAGQMGIYA
jgi:cellulose biosynthesis protein BcsQ